MRGTEPNAEELAAAKRFIELHLLIDSPAPDRSLTYRFEDLVLLVARFGRAGFNAGVELSTMRLENPGIGLQILPSPRLKRMLEGKH